VLVEFVEGHLAVTRVDAATEFCAVAGVGGKEDLGREEEEED